MTYLKLFFGSLLAGVLLTLVGMVGSLLLLMASTSEVGERAEGFFGAVYFQTTPTATDSFTMSVGIASGWPLLISTIVLMVFVFLFVTILRRLKAYRASLVETT
ncbi:MAG: hypothetical protein Q4B08_15790 [Propionibacteriaceae bacterium]|nr:hypothetical protein [Propionibacteriaceae bacterium]